MRKSILVPVDGSSSSIAAIRFASTLMNEEDSIILVNVQKPQYDGFGKIGNVTKDQLDAFYIEEGEKILNEARENSSEVKGKLEKIVKIGLPAIEITKVAKELEVHSIVMGSKGMSQVVSNALGSVTYSVIHLSPCPVTIVPYKD